MVARLSLRSRVAVISLAALVALATAQTAAAQPDTQAKLLRQLNALVAADLGPPGAVVTLRRGARTTVFTSGVSDLATGRKPRATDHMRIASMAKAFSGAVVFRLVAKGRLRLNSTIGNVLPGLPRAWRRVSVRRMLNHTSGLPDYTRSDGFREQFQTDPARVRVSGEGHRLGARGPPRLQAGQSLRVLEHRQHRHRPDGPGGHREVVREPAATLRVPAAQPARDELSHHRGSAAPVPARLPDRARLTAQ